MSEATETIECCPKSGVVVRTVLPSTAISRNNVSALPLSVTTSKQNAVEFKCIQMAKFGPEAIREGSEVRFKVGLVGSQTVVGRATQALASALTPGNMSVVRNPGRSALWSAATPGGGSALSGVANPLARAAAASVPKPERGFRCPEGFQFGGQFTDKYFSTCGKKLFALALSLLTRGRNIEDLVGTRLPRPIRVSGTSVVPRGEIGQLTFVRDPNIEIPKVGSRNFGAYREAIRNVSSEMGKFDETVSRLVRRDGVVLTPLVSPSVLRTVPDNRNMEGAAYVSYVKKPQQIGGKELGMFSNSGIDALVYVLPNGGTLTLRKTRNLSNGERRKLGKLVAHAEGMTNSNDPAARIEHIASEMDGPVSYEQAFGDLKSPNDMVTVSDPKTKKQRQVRRWYRDSFMLDARSSQVGSRETQIEDEAGMIDDLRSAISLVNGGGQIGNVSPELRIPALEMSRFAETRRVNNRTTTYKLGRDSISAISPSLTHEHLGVMTAAEVQSQLGALAPSVWFAGSGIRRPYLISYPTDSDSMGRLARNTGLDLADPEDMTRLMIADLLTDVIDRNPSNLYTVGEYSNRRTFGGPVASSGGAGLLRSELQGRVDLSRIALMAELETSMYREFFMKLRKEQKRRALALLEEMLQRARMFSFTEFKRRMSIDGKMSVAERIHMDIVGAIFDNRLSTLEGSLKFLRNVINGI